MRLLRIDIVLAMLFLSTVVVSCSSSDNGTEPVVEETNRVWVDRVTATSSDTDVRVQVSFTNLEPLLEVEIPLGVSGTGFTIDSVSFVGSRVSGLTFFEGVINDYSNTIDLVAIGDSAALIEAGSGLFGSLYFSLTSESRGQVLAIDSTTIEQLPIVHYLVYVDTTGQNAITPDFTAGEISVLY
jgi:hypothetical protein